MRSYIATKKRKHDNREEKFHVEADSIVEAAMKAHEAIDSLWEIVKVRVLK